MDNSKNKIKGLQLLFLLSLIVGTYFIARQEHGYGTVREIPFQKSEGMIFGTVYHAKYQHETNLNNEILRELNAVDASLSMFNPQSTISQINSNQTDQADSLLQIVYTLSRSISEATDGAFDVTVAPLVNAWGFGFKQNMLPDSTQVDSLRQFVGWQKIRLDGNHFHKDDERMVMDYSAVAKGFGVDQVASMFRSHNIKNFMIEIGGEVVAQGTNPKGQPWHIGINKPDDDSTCVNHDVQDIVTLAGNAIATSGNYRNFYVKDGKKIAHTIDPKTGYPVQHSILSSTVLAPTCAMADGYATAFMVMGLEQSKSFLKAHPQLQAYFIFSDNEGNYQTWCTSELKKNIIK